MVAAAGQHLNKNKSIHHNPTSLANAQQSNLTWVDSTSEASTSRPGTPLPPDPSGFTWIDDTRTSSASGGRRIVRRTARDHDKVRRHAATVSAAARLATIADRKRSPAPSGRTTEAAVPHKSLSKVSGDVVQNDSSDDDDVPPWYTLRILGGETCNHPGKSMNQKSTRTLLWKAVTNNAALWQVAYLVSGTYRNSCSRTITSPGLSTGLLYLRGKALEAIYTSITSGSNDHLTCLSIAMLAAWERRFGDTDIYDAHMSAWRRMPMPPSALEESNMDALMEAVQLGSREQLEERAESPNTTGTKHQYHYPSCLPIGFRRLPLNRPETRSLLNLLAQYTQASIQADDSIVVSRILRLQNMAWSPSHMLGYDPGDIPCVAHEDTWERQELWTLVHIRACLVSLTTFFGIAAHDIHKVLWTGDIAPGFEAHAKACGQLRTEELMGGKYQEIALWAQFTMCSISRVPVRDEQLRRWIKCCGVSSWSDMEALLERHAHPERKKTEQLYQLLMER